MATAKMSPKHRAFVNEYLRCFNATEAYARVYSPKQRTTAEVNGSLLLRNTKVAEALEKRMKEQALSVDEALAILSGFAKGSMKDVVEFVDGLSQPLVKITPENVHLIKEYDRDSMGRISVKIEDRQAALDKILKVHGAYISKHEITGKDGAPLAVLLDK